MTDVENNQLGNIKILNEIRNSKEMQDYLAYASKQLHSAQAKIPSAILGGKKVIDTDVYKSHLPVFTQICESIRLSGFMKALTYLNSLSDPADSTVVELSIEGLVKEFSKNITKEANKKMIAEIFIPNEEMERIQRGLDDYEHVSNQLLSNRDPIAQKKIAVDLFKDAHELYLKVLTDFYTKLTGKSLRKGDNKPLYDFYNQNYPVLMTTVNNVLRKDGAHLLYNERDNYTAKELLERSNMVIAAVFTAIIAYGNANIDLFEAVLKAFDIV